MMFGNCVPRPKNGSNHLNGLEIGNVSSINDARSDYSDYGLIVTIPREKQAQSMQRWSRILV